MFNSFFSFVKTSFLSIILSLIASTIFSYIQVTTFQDGKLVFGEFSKYKFLLYWFLVFFILFFIPLIFRKIISKRQISPSLFFSIRSDRVGNINYRGINWIVKYSYIHKSHSDGSHFKEIQIDDVEGPFCINDFERMNVSQIYLGPYKYKCPVCGKRIFFLKNESTLIHEVGNRVEAKNRRELYGTPTDTNI